MDMDSLMDGAGGAGGGQQEGDVVSADEMISISSLALLKMLKHGRAGVPLEVRFLRPA
jgi:26S proteasome regulatory subunit N11